MRKNLAATVVVLVAALCGFILVPAIQSRPAATLTTGQVCDAGSICGAEYVSLSCLAFGVGETHTVYPGYGYQFVFSGC